MSTYVFNPPAVTSIPVAGSASQFPIRRVYCVGRNYADHAIEMGVDPRAEPPFFFLKPADTVCSSELGVVDVPMPSLTSNFHYEVELVVAIGKGGANIASEQAFGHVWGYAIGVDMTRRDLQLSMRKSGKPWEIGKTFDRCAPMGPIVPVAKTGEILGGGIALTVGGKSRQSSNLGKLIWSVNEIIATLSTLFVLQPGDIIFTGTPEGVGPVLVGDEMVASIEGLGELRVTVSALTHGKSGQTS